ncbi:hypothetical protein Ae201684P_000613 [Aphanomyces euteiches]|uniref:non-reducing end alpha-L-arabinofuranosidase n=1 Tax=Aphanomyces euteiches TaxID=100861 RepID=A0A6G0XQR3_9STRA|nr:hypothetical protein Ae201684_002396 [Aphanomyces euteiches]KAH9087201.1 hypothetical protein Ae201684P_000613 [Aphanomyces euteiches]
MKLSLLTVATTLLVATLSNALNASVSVAQAGLPSSFKWTSTGPIISAKNDGKGVVAIKDPSIIQVGDTYHVFASTASASGYNLVYLNFKDPSQAQQATFHYLDQTPIGRGYRAAPEVFYFAPQKLCNPAGWSAPKNFYNGMPAIIKNNIGNGNWVDMFVICDSANCHLFSSDDNGHLYRSQTSLANFPNGMSQPVIALQDANKNNLFEASAVYKAGNQYLLIVEAAGSTGRYFRSWTASSLWRVDPVGCVGGQPLRPLQQCCFPRWCLDHEHQSR